MPAPLTRPGPQGLGSGVRQALGSCCTDSEAEVWEPLGFPGPRTVLAHGHRAPGTEPLEPAHLGQEAESSPGGKGYALEARLGQDRPASVSHGDPGQAALSTWFSKPGCHPSGHGPLLRPADGNQAKAQGRQVGCLCPTSPLATCGLEEERPGSLAWSPLAPAASRPWALHSDWLMHLGVAYELMPGPAAGRVI